MLGKRRGGDLTEEGKAKQGQAGGRVRSQGGEGRGAASRRARAPSAVGREQSPPELP